MSKEIKNDAEMPGDNDLRVSSGQIDSKITTIGEKINGQVELQAVREIIEKACKKATEVACKAGELLLKYFGHVSFEFKGDGSHVTKADKAAEAFIQQELKLAFPNFAFFGEESGQESSESDFEWVVDPLDGTINFGNSIDIFGVSIGLRYKGVPVAGVIHIPVQNDTFSGDVYTGSKLNGKKISVYNGELGKKKPYADTPWGAAGVITSDDFEALKGKPRVVGSAVHQLAYVANGGYGFSLGTNCYLWDLTAAIAIIRGAGGDMLIWDEEQWRKFEDVDGSKFNRGDSFANLAACNDNLAILRKSVSINPAGSYKFLDQPSDLRVVPAKPEIVDYDLEVLRKFQSLIPAIIEISKRNIIGDSAVEVSYKDDDTEQTNADVNVERELKALLLNEFHGFAFTGEEAGNVSVASRYGFIVDPIDGTSNYSNGLPIFSTTISLTCDGKPIGGMIYFPKLDMVVFNDDKNTFVNRFNSRGEWNPELVNISDDIFDVDDKNIPFGFDSHARSKAKYGAAIGKILNQPRTFGGATSIIAYTACGKLGGFVLSDAKLFDYAGGVSLIEKAGGKVFVLDDEAGEWREFSDMFDKLMQNLKKRRFVIGGGSKTVEKILRNIHPQI